MKVISILLICFFGLKTYAVTNKQAEDLVGWDAVKQLGLTGKKVKVLVLDSGVNMSQFKTTPGLYLHKFADNVSSGSDDEAGHGSFITALLKGHGGTPGLVPDIELHVGQICPERCSKENVDDYIEGLNWALDNDIDIVSLSLNFEIPRRRRKIFKELEEEGILVLSSSGNFGRPAFGSENFVKHYGGLGQPASYDTVFSVGMSNTDGSLNEDSSYGLLLDILAPGSEIQSIDLEGNAKTASGTSFAVVYATATAAILLEEYKTLSPEKVRRLLRYGSVTLMGVSPLKQGSGVLNAANSLNLLHQWMY